jgi:hypothetical protein
MGQYHRLVNLDKREWVNPHGLGLGSKQHEHTGAFNGSLSDAMYLLVMSSPARGGGDWQVTEVSGRWCGDRVVVLGDYTEDADISNVKNASALDAQIEKEFVDITPKVRDAFKVVFELDYELKVSDWNPEYSYWIVKDPERV